MVEGPVCRAEVGGASLVDGTNALKTFWIGGEFRVQNSHEDRMTRKTKVLFAGFTVVAVGLAATFAVAQYRLGTGGHRGGMGFHLGMFCEDSSRADGMLDRMEGRLQPTDTQKPV